LGYQGGLARIFFALLEPLWILVQWLVLAVIAHGAARLLGGSGTLVQTLGTTALSVAPSLLGLLTTIPFVSVSALLLGVWSLLIVYRAIEITHDLEWQRAALAALAAPVAVLLLGFVGTTITTLVLAMGSGA
jgi:hypothetical protein